MEQTIKRSRSEEHKRKGGIVKKAILPTFCFAALSTIAFEEAVHAAQTNPPQIQIVSEGTLKYVNVSSGSLNLRTSASAGAAVIATLSKGTAITVYSEINGWAWVKANGKAGYVSSIFLSSTNPSSSAKKSSSIAATTKYVNVSSGSLNLRTGASTSAEVISALSKGTAVSVNSETNGWSWINVNGKEGYVNSSFLSNTNSISSPGNPPTVGQSIASASTPDAPAATTKYVNISSGSLNLRKTASTSASIIVKLAKATAVKVYSEAGGWSKIEAYGQTGYVRSEFLSAGIQSPVTSVPPVQQVVTRYVNVSTGSSLNLRKNVSTSSTVLAKLLNGTEVKVYSNSNGWAKVQASGQEGYVSSAFLSETKPATTSKEEQTVVTKYVNVSLSSSLNMRKSASANSSIIVKIARGVGVTVSAESNGWAKIEAYGQTGFVSSEYLSLTKPSAGKDSAVDNNAGPDSTSGNNAGANAMPDGKGTDSQGENEVGTGSKVESNSGTDTLPVNSSGSYTGESVVKYVNVIYGSSLNMRSAAANSASVITKLARGTIVSVLSEENGWARITANGAAGYVSSKYLLSSEPFNPILNSGEPEKAYQNYTISLSDMTKIQMAVSPQTDKKYDSYIRADALTLTGSSSGTVRGTSWNIRGGAGTNYWVVGKVTNSDTLQILSKEKGTDGNDWYRVNFNKTWVNASPDDVAYYIDPSHFLNNTVDSLQFLKLSVPTKLSATEVDNRILAGKGSLQGQAAAFIDAGNTYGINEIYLISHALLETGNGTSQLANGVGINGKTVYNMYGIGAYDASAVTSGAQFAYNAGWFTPQAAIVGGAQFIANGYINAGQDTLYKMRWNPSSAVTKGEASHQYASDIGWASKQVNQIYNLYNLLDSYKLVLDIPHYQ
ncbi:SH3 domain-containing protein [Bacillus sp. EB600]|uniref:SH3 domain-containing protein n=1 Tax=Bacillus sp. EB600 TaxID=2806345 RepID=UPI00210CA316|nr:SH3 domain-containing protein [Bacillus sp. EB600]MCQ6277697.1 SH3 domain-containing protein [Bacillus sp. EB600]